MDLVESVQGKFCKQDPNGVIFAKRSDTGAKYVYHRHNASMAAPSAAQLAVQAKFKAAHEAVKTILSDPMELATATSEWMAQSQYKTLRGYIFQREFAKVGQV